MKRDTISDRDKLAFADCPIVAVLVSCRTSCDNRGYEQDVHVTRFLQPRPEQLLRIPRIIRDITPSCQYPSGLYFPRQDLGYASKDVNNATQDVVFPVPNRAALPAYATIRCLVYRSLPIERSYEKLA